MKMRMNYLEANPEAVEAMLQLESFMEKSGLRPDAVRTKELLTNGVGEERIYLLTAWREAPCYTEKERAALELTEAVTRISEQGVPDQVYENVRRHFSEKEIVTLLMAINVINCWNRLAISTGMFPGCVLPAKRS